MSDEELTKMLRSSANRVVNYAGDRIEALTAKVAELEACLERQGSGHREDLDEIANVSVERLRRAKAAEAERDRLRAKLADAAVALDAAGMELSDFANCLSREPWAACLAYEAAIDARATLKGESRD